ncbi:MAG: efflux RND transporter permease subunit, partial [Vallitaleaceae bacterium]|nr:efflux RND transporter permease subunit [Vallitaleaceae bacterium]
ERVVYVESDPQKLYAYNLTIEQVSNAIRMENLNVPAGNVRMGKEDYQMRIEGEFKSSSDIENLVVGNFNGKSIFLKDIAVVNDTLKDLTMEEKVNGRDAIRFFVTKQSGTNTVEVANEVKKQMEIVKQTLPADVQINEIFDFSNFIKSSITGLSDALMYALIFVVLVILFFLGRWRATFIIVLTIPISLIVSFIYLYVSGSSLNVISLSSLTIAIGMVVDDAIVVLENISKHIERGSSPREAAVYATNEVWLSVIVTTMVILAVFLPLTLVGGETGMMFKELGYIVSITVTMSTIAAITLTPTLSSLLLKLKNKDEKPSWHKRVIVPKLDKLDGFYERTVRWGLRNRWTVVISAILIFISSMSLFSVIEKGNLPESDQGMIASVIEVQRGTRVEETVLTSRKIEKFIKENVPEIELVSSSAGASDEGSFIALFSTTGTNMINLNIRLKDKKDRDKDVWELASIIREQIGTYPEVIDYTVTPNGGMMSGQQPNQVDVEIFGYDFDITNGLAQQIKDSLSTIKGATDITVSRKNDKAQLQIEFDREKLAKLGLNSAMVSNAVRNRVSGQIASLMHDDGDEFKVIVRYNEESRNSISDIEDITFTTPRGEKVKLKELGVIKELWSPPSITHKRKERTVTVVVKPDGVSIGTLAADINKKLETIDVPQGVLINVGGAFESMQESFADLGLLLLLALALVYIVMASQFESFSKPFVITLSAFFGFSGVAIALFITGSELNMISGLGAILLIGIVVKNGIVLVDYTNLLRDRGLEVNEALAQAGKSRLRPVLMTATTTILGMLPMALSTSEGSEVWRPMGIAVIGGLIFSTIVTMIIVPVVYSLMSRHGE